LTLFRIVIVLFYRILIQINEKITPNQYLYLGSERIAHEHKYNTAKNDEVFDELVEMADEAKNKMIQGAIKVIEKEGKGYN
jgi:chromosome condensin MukBEF MukE localization factor